MQNFEDNPGRHWLNHFLLNDASSQGHSDHESGLKGNVMIIASSASEGKSISYEEGHILGEGKIRRGTSTVNLP